MHAPDTARIVSDNYVVVNLTVQERDDKKALDNPGGEEMLLAYFAAAPAPGLSINFGGVDSSANA